MENAELLKRRKLLLATEFCLCLYAVFAIINSVVNYFEIFRIYGESGIEIDFGFIAGRCLTLFLLAGLFFACWAFGRRKPNKALTYTAFGIILIHLIGNLSIKYAIMALTSNEATISFSQIPVWVSAALFVLSVVLCVAGKTQRLLKIGRATGIASALFLFAKHLIYEFLLCSSIFHPNYALKSIFVLTTYLLIVVAEPVFCLLIVFATQWLGNHENAQPEYRFTQSDGPALRKCIIIASVTAVGIEVVQRLFNFILTML